MVDVSERMRTRMVRKRFLECLARTVSVEGRGQKAVLERVFVGKGGEELLILIVNKLFDEFKMKWRRALRLYLERKERSKVTFSKTEASKAYCTARGKSK